MYFKVISMLDDFNDCVYSVDVRGDNITQMIFRATVCILFFILLQSNPI